VVRATIPNMANQHVAEDGKVAKLKAPNYLPKTFTIFVGGYFNPSSYSVRFENGVLVCRRGILCEEQSLEITPAPEAWQRFWDKVDLLGVWKWQKSYSSNDTMDGTQWEVDMQVESKRLKSSGSNTAIHLTMEAPVMNRPKHLMVSKRQWKNCSG